MVAMLAWAIVGSVVPGATHAAGEAYPAKPVRIVVPFAAGGGADLIARVIGQKLQEKWGVPVIIDNRGGAGGNIAAEVVATSPADGYTLFEYNVANAIAVSVYKKLNYDPVKDFTPVTLIARSPFILIASPTLAATSVQDLLAQAKANPGKMSFASSGNGGSTHLAGELLKTMAVIDVTHVPYKGAAPAMTDLMAGRVQFMFVDPASGLSMAKAGKVRAIAVTSQKRTPLAPDLPTVAESGVPGYESGAWFGLALPANAPRAVVDKLNADVRQVLELPDVRERLAGYELAGSTPEQFGEFVKAELTRWSRVVKVSGAQAE
ncbi:MAG: tripartite tricarboxylate transporter substrate binding protein [Casimicrobiaceae bacterium]